jgi:hypothetical protein
MGITSWRGQIDRALGAIDQIGESKYQAKREQDWQPGETVAGLFSHGYRNTVFDRAVTFTNWLRVQYPAVRLFREVDHEMTAEFLGEKVETCAPDTVRTLLATLKKLQEGLYALHWIHEDIVPVEWQINGRNPPRGPYVPDEAKTLQHWVEARDAEYGQALRFILASGARIDETLHLRADKIFGDSKRVELIGKGGRVHPRQAGAGVHRNRGTTRVGSVAGAQSASDGGDVCVHLPWRAVPGCAACSLMIGALGQTGVYLPFVQSTYWPHRNNCN